MTAFVLDTPFFKRWIKLTYSEIEFAMKFWVNFQVITYFQWEWLGDLLISEKHWAIESILLWNVSFFREFNGHGYSKEKVNEISNNSEIFKVIFYNAFFQLYQKLKLRIVGLDGIELTTLLKILPNWPNF